MIEGLLQSVLLGVVEGLTEFLPISSTGHLILVGHWIGFKGQQEEFFDVFIQLGAILAVVFLYTRRFILLFKFEKGASVVEGFEGLAGILKLGVACLPAFITGALFHSLIKEELFSPITVASALLVGAVLMITVEMSKRQVRVRDLEEVGIWQALFIGIMQCLALWPGMSRSACTIVGALLCGLERKVAAEFSFLVAVPVMCAAVAFDAYKAFAFVSIREIPLFGAGCAVSFFTAIIAIRVFIDLLNRFTLIPFAVYRIVLGIVVLSLCL